MKIYYICKAYNFNYNRNMNRRGVASAKGAIIKERINFKPININKSKFIDESKLTKSTSYILQNKSNEINVDEKTIKESTLDTLTYKRNNFIITGIEFFDIIGDLSPKAFKLLNYIIKNIKLNYNYIDLATDNIKLAINDKYDSNCSKAIKELIDNNIIDRDKQFKYRYVINQNMFFKGNYNKLIYNYNKHCKTN